MIVLLIIDTLQTGGAEKSILEIASRFKVFKPVVCTLFSKKADLLPEFRRRSIEVVELGLNGPTWLLQGKSQLREVINKYQPSIVHATLFKSELLARFTLFSSSIVHINSFVNDSYSVERYRQQTTLQNFKLNLYKAIDALTAKKVHHFISITSAVAKTNTLALGIPLSRVSTIYRGREIDRYEISHPSKELQPFIFLTVARLLKRKGYNELLSAARILREKEFTFKVLIAGEGHDRAEFEKYVSNNKLQSVVEFLGNRNDVPKLLNQANCFVLPSHYEGQGGALVEAMLAGKPIVATEIPVFKEQILNNETGVLFNILSAQDLADKMFWVYHHYEEAKKMGKRAREVAVKRFNIDSVSTQYEKLYQKLLEK